MHYYKSQELAKLYNVSRRTVTNWIQQTQDGKLDLELTKDKNEFYIVKSITNQSKIKTLVQERRKYLNKRSRKYINPSSKFYELYTDAQIHDIINSLITNRELPLQYSYFDKGAHLWDTFRSRPGGSFDPEKLTPGIISYLDTIISKYETINVVDVGVGNGMAARTILSHIKEQQKLGRYIGIDISKDMLDIATGNIREWFNDEINIETHIKDVSYESFGDIIAEPADPKSKKRTTINLVLLFGGHISNFKTPSDVLRVLNRSMGPEDILASTFRLGSPQVKNQLGFISSYQQQCELVLDMMGIHESYYETEIGFDEKERMRYGRIRLKRSLHIEFSLPKGKWYVELNKGDSILTYRARFNDPFTTPKELFFDNGFNPLLISHDDDHESMFLIADLNIFSRE